MSEIGVKIREIRKRKGLSQEELATSSNVNLRTIQRIENSESEPRGTTLKLICETLDVNVEDILDYGKSEDTGYMVLFHLSAVTFLVIPIGNIILPLILWLTRKDKVIGLKEAGENLLNFQIIWSVLFYVSMISAVFCKLNGNGTYATLFFYICFGLCLLNLILPILFAIMVSKERKNSYPTIFRLVR